MRANQSAGKLRFPLSCSGSASASDSTPLGALRAPKPLSRFGSPALNSLEKRGDLASVVRAIVVVKLATYGDACDKQTNYLYTSRRLPTSRTKMRKTPSSMAQISR